MFNNNNKFVVSGDGIWISLYDLIKKTAMIKMEWTWKQHMFFFCVWMVANWGGAGAGAGAGARPCGGGAPT